MSQSSSTSSRKRAAVETTSPEQDIRNTPPQILLAVKNIQEATSQQETPVSLNRIDVCTELNLRVLFMAMLGFEKSQDITGEAVGSLQHLLQQCRQEGDIDTTASDAADVVPDVKKKNWEEIIRAWFVASKGGGEQLLISLGKEKGFKEKEANSARWLFSHPLPLDYEKDVLKALQTSFENGVETIKSSLKENKERNDSKGPVILAVQSGIGIGKSHACDHAAQLCFPDLEPEEVLVVKVSYNFRQGLVREKETETNANQGLLARMLLDINLNINSGLMVEQVFNAFLTAQGSLDVEMVTKRIVSKRPKAFILAIDEVGQLVNDKQHSARQVLTTACACLTDLYDKASDIASAVLVTALPTLDFKSLSQRQPNYIQLSPASDEVSKAILLNAFRAETDLQRKPMRSTSTTAGGQGDPRYVDGDSSNIAPIMSKAFIDRAILTAGGHYRTLVVIGQLIARHPTGGFPTLDLIAENAVYRKYIDAPQRYIEAIVDQYLGDKTTLDNIHRSDGVVFQEAIIPLCLLNAARTLSSGPSGGLPAIGVEHLFSMILPSTEGVSAAKALENHHEHWDAYRAAKGLPVIPESMRLNCPAGLSDEFWTGNTLPKGLKYTFTKHEACLWVKDRILQQTKGIEPSFCPKDIDTNLFYVPEADNPTSNHRGYESMGVAKDEDGILYLVLYQSKASQIADSIPKLNAAANDLSSDTLYYVYKEKAYRAQTTPDGPSVQTRHKGNNPPEILKALPKWKGDKKKFLFIISALGDDMDLSLVAKCPPEHPTLFVTKDLLNDYFTPTLAHGAKRLKVLHESSS